MTLQLKALDCPVCWARKNRGGGWGMTQLESRVASPGGRFSALGSPELLGVYVAAKMVKDVGPCGH